ncbi:MAG: hypothetical protein SOW08_13055 [Lachnospiraceae bacterium]|nr:hypothetical protein [Lachnospiraceae bacterium]
MIFKEEFKKLFLNPFLWCLLLFFSIYNLFLIWAYVGAGREELQAVHEEIMEIGVDPEAYEEKIENTAEDEDSILSFYMSCILRCRSLYDKLDMIDLKEMKEEMSDYHPTGLYKKYIDTGYERLQNRVEQIRGSKKENQGFYPGEYYGLQGILYGKIMKTIIAEMALLMICSVLYLMDYERNQKTEELVYVSRMGKNVQKIKISAGLLAGLLTGCILMGITLTGYFTQVSYEGLWDVSVSTSLMAESRGVLFYPFITFFPMTVRIYLAASIVTILLLVLGIGILTAGIQLVVRSSYISFILEALLFLLLFFLAGLKTVTFLDVIFAMNPVTLWYTCRVWFMENDPALCFPGSEAVSLLLQFLTAGILLAGSWKQFCSRDVI